MHPLSTRLLQALYPLLEEDYRALQNAEQEHRNTHSLLRRVVNGEIPLSRVIVSDDGWQVLPEPPSDD